ncbi:FAD-binding domain-containing protein [Acephala macrosclerotiorum]|nr:FAD-binding domain-containing protein [Acephala macrosclerotiorum]
MGSRTNPIIDIATELNNSLSKSGELLLEPRSEGFKTSMSRWSSEDPKTPAAIFKPATEDDIVKIVKTATENKIPFVPKSGGNTPWSSIEPEGWIIDLSLLQDIKVDSTNETVTLQAGVLTKPLNVAVSNKGFVIPSPSGSAVSYTGFMPGGGSSYLAGIYGMAVDSLLSAKVVTATKGLVTCSSSENPDLFWALKGAGQFFGVVTEVTMRIYRLEHPIMSWTLVFLPGQVEAVSKVLEGVVDGCDKRSPGMCAVMAPPGQTEPMLIVSITHFRPESEAEKVMAPLVALNPTQNIKREVFWASITDASDSLSKHGGYNTLVSCGLQRFDGKQFEQSLESWTKMIEEVLGVARTMMMFGWYSNEVLKSIPEGSTAWSHRDCPVWFMGFISASEAEASTVAMKSAYDFVAFCQKDQKDEEKALFPNHTRGDNLKYRYRGEERLKKLRELKKTWDPEGVFTRQFL